MSDLQFWSDELAAALLQTLPEDQLKHWAALDGISPAAMNASLAQLHDELLQWSKRDAAVRRWIVKTWRESHCDIVEAADQALIEKLTERAVQFVESFPPHKALLAFLTDEFADGRELAKAFVGQVRDDSKRRMLQAELQRLVGDNGETSEPRVRVVILGGHPRDESKLDSRLFDNSPFDVRWQTFEKKPSSGLIQRRVTALLRHADALLIITGMASHILMQFAKDYARQNNIRWKCIEKATDMQLKAALQELFPERTAEWG